MDCAVRKHAKAQSSSSATRTSPTTSDGTTPAAPLQTRGSRPRGWGSDAPASAAWLRCKVSVMAVATERRDSAPALSSSMAAAASPRCAMPAACKNTNWAEAHCAGSSAEARDASCAEMNTASDQSRLASAERRSSGAAERSACETPAAAADAAGRDLAPQILSTRSATGALDENTAAPPRVRASELDASRNMLCDT